MIIKQFLKPDRRKIATFVVILVIFYLSGQFGYPLSIISIILVLPLFILSQELYTNYMVFLFSIILVLPLFILTQELYTNHMVFLFSIILLVIFWYLLSCLIVWIYDKFRKEK